MPKGASVYGWRVVNRLVALLKLCRKMSVEEAKRDINKVKSRGGVRINRSALRCCVVGKTARVRKGECAKVLRPVEFGLQNECSEQNRAYQMKIENRTRAKKLHANAIAVGCLD